MMEEKKLLWVYVLRPDGVIDISNHICNIKEGKTVLIAVKEGGEYHYLRKSADLNKFKYDRIYSIDITPDHLDVIMDIIEDALRFKREEALAQYEKADRALDKFMEVNRIHGLHISK